MNIDKNLEVKKPRTVNRKQKKALDKNRATYQFYGHVGNLKRLRSILTPELDMPTRVQLNAAITHLESVEKRFRKDRKRKLTNTEMEMEILKCYDCKTIEEIEETTMYPQFAKDILARMLETKLNRNNEVKND